MTVHLTKTWIEDGKLIKEIVPQEAIYKREWVGLTDEERTEIRSKVQVYTAMDNIQYGLAIQRATETKLKEKNT